MPEFFPQPQASCALAAHVTTLKARIHRPNGLPPPVHSQEQHSLAQAHYGRDGSVSPKRQADGNEGKVSPVASIDSVLSVQSSGTYYDEKAGKAFSIVITAGQGGRNISLMRSGSTELEVKRFNFQGPGEGNKTTAAHHASTQSDSPRHQQGPLSMAAPTDRQSSLATSTHRAAVVPRLQLMQQAMEGVDHSTSGASAKSKQSGWSQGKKKTSALAGESSKQGVAPGLALPHLNPGDDPGISGVGWVAGDVRTARGADKGSVKTALKSSEPKVDGPDSRKGHADTQSSQRRVPIVGIIATDGQPSRAPSEWRRTTAKTPREMMTGETEVNEAKTPATTAHTGQWDAKDLTQERPSGIREGTLEKLRVWYDDSDGESDAGSDTLDPVTTAKSMPTRNVQFVRSPPKEKDARQKTPNTAREEQLCEWENSARGTESARTGQRDAHAKNCNSSHPASSRRISTQGSGLSDLPGRTPGRKPTRGRNALATPYSGTSSQSRYVTGDTVHEYVAIRDTAGAADKAWRHRFGQRQSQVSIVTFSHEPTPEIPMGIVLKGGKVRSSVPENLDQRKCYEVIVRSEEPESNVERFIPLPQGELEPKEYQEMLRAQGLQPLVMNWGSGMAMNDVPDIEDIIRGEDQENFETMKYYPKQRLPGSEVRSAQIRRRKIIRINPAGT